jgi:hypothetical protein
MAGTGSADGTPFACSQTGDQLFVPPWTRFRSAHFLFQRATLFSLWSACHAHGTSPPRVALPGGLDRSKEPTLGTDSDHLLILLVVGALPTWPYSNGWGYYPGGGIGLNSDHRAGPGRTHIAAVSILARHCEHQRSNPKGWQRLDCFVACSAFNDDEPAKMTLSG